MREDAEQRGVARRCVRPRAHIFARVNNSDARQYLAQRFDNARPAAAVPAGVRARARCKSRHLLHETRAHTRAL